ncbi:hypothetical protein BH23PLA1_BH23PLA1_07330 [soil metagenome]
MDDRHPRRGHPRPRRRRNLNTLERLEGRELLAFTPLGFSLPDPAILGASAGPIAAYGRELAVSVDFANLGASTIVEPLALTPGARSSADLEPSQIGVFFSPNARFPFARRIQIGTIDVPALPQNSLTRVTGVVTLPEFVPRGFPGIGQTGFITVQADPNFQVRDLDRTNNILRRGIPVQIAQPLPDLEAIALDLPPVLNPGDTFLPKLKVANFGAVSTAEQGPVVVQVVAAFDAPFYGPGSEILATFVVEDIPGLNLAPTPRLVPGDANLFDPPNVVTLVADAPVTLPLLSSTYFVGVAVDPFDTILELSELQFGPDPRLEEVRLVTPTGIGLPPAGIVSEPSTAPFPFRPFTITDPTPLPPIPPETIPPVTGAGSVTQRSGPALSGLFNNRPGQSLLGVNVRRPGLGARAGILNGRLSG